MALQSIVLTAEAAAHESGVNPLLVGVGTFVVLVALLLGLVSFGGGREHS